MKSHIVVTLITFNIFLVGCNAQNNEILIIDSTQEKPFVTIGQNVDTSNKDDDLNLYEDVKVGESESLKKQETIIAYDEGHQQLQKVMDELKKHADDLANLVPFNGKGDYIGFDYATYQLYNYLLAIYYKGEDLLDSNYAYTYSYKTFDELTKTYYENIDFNTVELELLNHKDFDIEIKIRYKNKITNNMGYLKYFISYGKHGLLDLSDFY